MSIFDSILGRKTEKRISSEEESLALIETYILPQEREFMDVQSHKQYTKIEQENNIYQFTTKMMSLSFLVRMGKDSRVKNIYFTSRHSAPGGSLDSISLRHNIIIVYV
jgi:hypothetical protein